MASRSQRLNYLTICKQKISACLTYTVQHGFKTRLVVDQINKSSLNLSTKDSGWSEVLFSIPESNELWNTGQDQRWFCKYLWTTECVCESVCVCLCACVCVWGAGRSVGGVELTTPFSYIPFCVDLHCYHHHYQCHEENAMLSPHQLPP